MNIKEAATVKVGDVLKYFSDPVEVLEIIQRADYKRADVERVPFPLFKVKGPREGQVSEITYKLCSVVKQFDASRFYDDDGGEVLQEAHDPKRFDSGTN